MELFNKSGILVASVLVAVGVLIGVQAKEDMVPPAPVIEAAASQMSSAGGAAAERRLREWADQGSVVAQRELAILYQNNGAKREEAMRLFEEAAQAGDTESATQLAAMSRETQRTELGSLKESATARSNAWSRY